MTGNLRDLNNGKPRKGRIYKEPQKGGFLCGSVSAPAEKGGESAGGTHKPFITLRGGAVFTVRWKQRSEKKEGKILSRETAPEAGGKATTGGGGTEVRGT